MFFRTEAIGVKLVCAVVSKYNKYQIKFKMLLNDSFDILIVFYMIINIILTFYIYPGKIFQITPPPL